MFRFVTSAPVSRQRATAAGTIMVAEVRATRRTGYSRGSTGHCGVSLSTMGHPGDGDDFSIDDGGEGKTGVVPAPKPPASRVAPPQQPPRSTSQPLIPIPTRQGNPNPFGPRPVAAQPPPPPPPMALGED